uniref:RNA polymerase sigma-70 domain-containing protein n=1 Tax=Pseudictyota dubia TaxID=2749911 RepID=A0A6U2IBU4_9STRA|mmetsp:Transcript_5111/g.8845  ORF Transcript_5111/g.8845 Transcript_5111/m.8845 type:complete len:231 (+) Transcript_5111:155-847(+)
MLRSIADTSRVIRLPAHVHSKLGTIRRARQDLEKDLGRPPTDDELSDHLDLPVDKLRLYAGSALNVLSLESPVGSPSSRSLDDRRRALGDVIASHAPTPEEDALSRSFRGEVRAAVEGCLSDRERDVLVLRFGLEDGTPRSVGDTARELGLSRDRVRTVEARALNKLRHPRRNRGLMEYVNGGGGGSGEDRYGQMDDEEVARPAPGPPAAGGAGAVDYVVGSSPESLWSF